jgi:hypothetical protein
MKKIITISILGILSLSLFVSTIQANYTEDSLIIIESIQLSDPIFKETGEYIIVELENTSIFYKNEKPMLPAITKIFTFPFGTKIVDVDVQYNSEEYILSKKIFPCQSPRILYGDNQIDVEDITFDKKIYYSNEFYPKNPISINKGSGLHDDEHVLFLTVKVTPQYNPMKDIICIPKNIDINVYYLPPEEPLFTSDEFDMIIITPEIFLDSLEPLVDHKNNVGVKTFCKTTEEIYKKYDGRDKSEQIKYFIKDAVENFGINYVLLVGDIDLVPMRKSDVTVIAEMVIWNGILTDLYYADIYDSTGGFSNWNSNENGFFGECLIDIRSGVGDITIIDNVDLYPDVGVGRFPCSNEEEVNIISEKIIIYETETYGCEWFNRMILMSGDTSPEEDDIIFEGEWIHEKYIVPKMESHGFKSVRLFTSLDTFSIELINEEITNGAGFVSYSGHGKTNRISTYLPNNQNSKITYSIKDIESMNNSYKLPIFFLDACLTGKLDNNKFDNNTILNLFPFCLLKILIERLFDTKTYPCFILPLLNKQSGGSISVIASSQLSWHGIEYNDNETEVIFGSLILHRYFFEAYESGIILSDMFVKSQNSYINMIASQDSIVWDRNTIDEFNLIGDPSLKVGGYS